MPIDCLPRVEFFVSFFFLFLSTERERRREEFLERSPSCRRVSDFGIRLHAKRLDIWIKFRTSIQVFEFRNSLNLYTRSSWRVILGEKYSNIGSFYVEHAEIRFSWNMVIETPKNDLGSGGGGGKKREGFRFRPIFF